MTHALPYDPFQLMVAEAIAGAAQAEVVLLYGLAPGSTSAQQDTTQDYAEKLSEAFAVPLTLEAVETRNGVGNLATAITDADLIVVPSQVEGVLRAVKDQPMEQLVKQVDDVSVLYTRPHNRPQISLLRRAIWDRIY